MYKVCGVDISPHSQHGYNRNIYSSSAHFLKTLNFTQIVSMNGTKLIASIFLIPGEGKLLAPNGILVIGMYHIVVMAKS